MSRLDTIRVSHKTGIPGGGCGLFTERFVHVHCCGKEIKREMVENDFLETVIATLSVKTRPLRGCCERGL